MEQPLSFSLDLTAPPSPLVAVGPHMRLSSTVSSSNTRPRRATGEALVPPASDWPTTSEFTLRISEPNHAQPAPDFWTENLDPSCNVAYNGRLTGSLDPHPTGGSRRFSPGSCRRTRTQRGKSVFQGSHAKSEPHVSGRLDSYDISRVAAPGE